MRKIILLISFFCISDIYANIFDLDIVAAAQERTNHKVRYDGSYIKLKYPLGDVPSSIGVCTDVIIRAYRNIGTDFQQLIHEDISTNFASYPSKRIWGLTRPDKNIDHRRVPNLQTFFKRNGIILEINSEPSNYKAGELVTWLVSGNLPHIGIVTDIINVKTGNPLIVHNIGSGPKLDDMLFDYPITGHYKYVPEKYKTLK